jgi:hypothetical protein
MRRWLTSIVLTAVIAVAVGIALAGCGSQKRTIPTKTGQSFLRQLDNIQSQYDNGSCSGTRAKVAVLEAQARQLPNSVDSKVKQNLIDGIARLRTLVAACKPATPTNTTPTTVPTVPTVTQTVPTVTNTVPTTPTTPNTVPTTPNTTPNTTPTTPGGGGGVSVPGTGVGGGTP